MKIRARHITVIVFVVLIAAAIGLAVFLRKRGAPEPARLLPESDAVLYVNLKTVRRLTSFGDKPVQREAEYEDFVKETGFQFERDLDEAAFAMHTVQRPPAKKGAPPTSETRYSEIFVGRFDSGKLGAYLKKISRNVEQYRETAIYNIPVEDRTVRVAIIGLDSVAVSNHDDPAILRGIIDRSRQMALPFPGPRLVADNYRKVPFGSMVWALANIPAAPADPRAARAITLPGGFDMFIPSQSTMVASVRYLGSIHARAEFYTASADDAKRFTEQANTFLQLFKSIEANAQVNGADPDVKAAFDSLKVEQQGERAILSATIPAGFFKKLLSEPPVEVGAPNQPTNTAPTK